MPDDRNPDRPDGEFDGVTRLYIRTNPADDGTEPLPAGLPAWISPDIVIVQPGGTVGGEAVPLEVNQVRVTVTNGGGIPAVDAYVDAFVADPATLITPATASVIGGGFVTIQAYSTTTMDLPWTPTLSDSGHRCLIARVSLILPSDTYADPTVFDVVGDRHVAQRNIQVLEVPQGTSMTFRFRISSPNGGQHIGRLKAVERTQELDARTLATAGGCSGGLPARRPLAELGVRVLSPRESQGRPTLAEDGVLTLGVARRAELVPDVREVGRLAGSADIAAVTFTVDPADEQGRLHAVEIHHLDDSTGEILGGLTFILRVS
jgi:hypothetical protein